MPPVSAQHPVTTAQTPSLTQTAPTTQPNNPNPASVHPMVTRFRVGTNRPTERLNLHVSLVSPLQKSYRVAFIPRPSDTNIVRCMWLFRYKYLADCTLSRYKARLVANGSTQLEGLMLMRLSVRQGIKTAYLLLYIDDIVLTASSEILLQEIIRLLHQEFAMTDLGPLNYFLKPHFAALKRIMQYVRGTLDYGLQLFSSSTTYLVAYSDADWTNCPITRRSTSGYCVFLGNNLLSWSSKRQTTLSRSSAEAEYCGVANAVAETCWLRNLLLELHTPLSFATFVYYDNVSAVYLSCNLVQHQRTKHIEIDIHFVRDLVAAGQVRVLHVLSRYQFADIFTKGLPSALFEEFRSSLSVRCSLASTVREC
ncbi:ribonuclease H-like domain-containing protein [Tanacetum coccineum]